MGTKSAWTPERKARQALIIEQTKPWEKSTGPRTGAGKAVSSKNAYLGDWVHMMRARIDAPHNWLGNSLEEFPEALLGAWPMEG